MRRKQHSMESSNPRVQPVEKPFDDVKLVVEGNMENLIVLASGGADKEILSEAATNGEPKKIKTTDAKTIEETSVDRESEEDSSPWARALKIDLILHRIFRYIPTGVLLSQCSLINKCWNSKVRSFIWNYRKCTLKKETGTPTCEFLKRIHEFCSQITVNGRLVPFNSLVLMSQVDEWNKCKHKHNDAGRAKNLGKYLKMKYLMAFTIWHSSECRIHEPFFTLLSENQQSELRSLTIAKVQPFCNVLSHAGRDLGFPKLQELKIVNLSTHGMSQSDVQSVKEVNCERLLQCAPRLEEIYVQSVRVLEIFPEEKYKLVKKLNFWLHKNEDIQVLRKVAQQCCGIEELRITKPPAKNQVRRGKYGEDQPVNAILRREFETAVAQLLETCKGSLKFIFIVGDIPGAQLSYATLAKVTRFRIEKRHRGTAPSVWNTIAAIDYAKTMPKLQKMEITIETLVWSEAERGHVAGDESDIEWPGESSSGEISSCTSVRELILSLQVGKVNLYLLKRLVPNVTKVVAWFSNTWVTWNDLPSVSEILELWPCLEQLEIHGGKNCLKRSYDADFCGVSEDEADLLRGKDEDFLQAVHIVPLRPCLSTMKYLSRLEIDLKFSGRACRSRSCRSLAFVSKVTELVVLKRMPDKDFRISGTLDAVESDDDEGDNDDDGEDDCNCHDDDEEHGNANNEDEVDGESDASNGDGDNDAYEDEEGGDSDDYENEAEEESDASIEEEEEGDSDSNSDDNEGGNSDDVDIPEDHDNDRDSGEDDGNAEQSD